MKTKSDYNKIISITDYLWRGEVNALSTQELCEIFDCKPTELKACMQAERRTGKIICSSNKGYYLPQDDTEVISFYKHYIYFMI